MPGQQNRRSSRTERVSTTGADSRGGGSPLSALLNTEDVSQLLSCSKRHIFRLADSGRMPQPIRLGTALRWRPQELSEWIADGCPPRQ